MPVKLDSVGVPGSRGIDTFAVGVGPHVDNNELNVIASDREHVFTVDAFHDLPSIHQAVVDSICESEQPCDITHQTYACIFKLCVDALNVKRYVKSFAWSIKTPCCPLC